MSSPMLHPEAYTAIVELALRIVKKEAKRLTEKAAGAIVPGPGE